MQIEKFIQENAEKFSLNPFSKSQQQIHKQLVFGEIRRSYLNEFRLFMSNFNAVPNIIEEGNINCKKAAEWLLENYGKEIKDIHYSKIQFRTRKNQTPKYDDLFFFSMMIC